VVVVLLIISVLAVVSFKRWQKEDRKKIVL